MAPDVQETPRCRFDHRKKAWEDKISDFTKADAGPCETRIKALLSWN